MDRWRNKAAIVTGASSGIGAAIALDLVKAGMIVAAMARREDRLEELREKLSQDLQSKFHSVKCDVSDEEEVKEKFKWVDETFGGIHVLINNAGILRATKLIHDGNTNDIRDTIETNIMGVFYGTREAYRSMKSRNIAGHIVNVNSVAGHFIPHIPGHFANMYPPSKHAATAMTETYRQEFSSEGTDIKITSISPGAVKTDIFPEEVKNLMKDGDCVVLNPEDVSNAIVFCISTPPHVQIHELMIKPLHEQF
ncbi:DHRS11.2 family protein [Megaselia abdita]